ncbi:MAG: hypothetical protein PHZ03_00220 [Syntrophomonas sp.]|nr:hypothetical protein [Syntrophomonas sp.]
MGIKIVDVQEGSAMAARLALEKKLIPFIGSGFTAYCKSRQGYCPTVEQLKEISRNLLIKFNDYLLEDINEIKTHPIRTFFDIAPRSDVKTFFLDYFTEIELEQYKMDFLNVIDWPRVYTFNIDNAIETHGNFQALLPYTNYKDYVISRRPVYKLYGDAYSEAVFDDCEGVSFRNGYVKNLTAKKNADFVESIGNDFASNNIIYVGTRITQKHIRDIYQKSKPVQSLQRIIVLDTVPTPEEEEGLLVAGVNLIILVKEYKPFYTTFVDCYRKMAANRNSSESA